MQRIKVDLPEPEGPQITIRSPLATSRLMSRSTWKSPYHLFKVEMLTIEFSLIVISSVAPVCIQPALDEQGVARHSKAEGEVDDAREGKARKQRRWGRPVRIGERGAKRAEKIEQRDDRHQRGVLEQGDEAVDEARDDM